MSGIVCGLRHLNQIGLVRAVGSRGCSIFSGTASTLRGADRRVGFQQGLWSNHVTGRLGSGATGSGFREYHWQSWKPGQGPPEGAVIAGKDRDQAVIYVGRSDSELPDEKNVWYPVGLIPDKSKVVNTKFGGECIGHCEILCGSNVEWVKAVKLEVGRRLTGSAIPSNAIITEKGGFYVGRVQGEGHFYVGAVRKWPDKSGVLYVATSDNDMQFFHFEILTYK